MLFFILQSWHLKDHKLCYMEEATPRLFQNISSFQIYNEIRIYLHMIAFFL